MSNEGTPGVYIGDIACAFGEQRLTMEESGAQGLLLTDAVNLRRAGFVHQRVCLPETTAYDLAKLAVQRLEQSLTNVGALLYHTALPPNASHLPPSVFAEKREVRYLTDFPVSRLQADFGLESAFTLGIAQQACTGLHGAIRVARALLSGEPSLREVLCVSADRVPEGGLRESSYNPLADGAIACLVGRRPGRFRVVAAHHIANGALSFASADEVVGNYFSYTARLIQETLSIANLTLAQIQWIVPQNLAVAAWRVMSSLLKFDPERVLFPTMAELGHLVTGCNFANLADCLRSGRFGAGERILVPVAGYGLNWQCLVLEHT